VNVHHHRPGIVGSAAVLAVACLSACTTAAEDKAGEPAGIELKMADSYSSLDFEPAVQAFVDEVGHLSAGQVRVKVVHDFGGSGPDLEQRVLSEVADGYGDLGWVGTRVLDTVGVSAFQALTAPFLIDSYDLQEAVLGSDLPGRMLPALEHAGVTGLALLAGGLRHPVSAVAPLATAADWRGTTVQTFRSQGQSDAITALGATPTDVVFAELSTGLGTGAIRGMEKNLLVYSLNQTETLAPYIVDDVVLWPETSVLFAAPDLQDRLTQQQWTWIRDAAAAASEQSRTLVDTDQQLATELCDRGARFISAGPDQLAALQDAERPLYARLAQQPKTAAAIDEIRQLRADLPAEAPLDIPPWCRDVGTAGQPR
jgi:TRAP-type C4-dicarboxylate transport system substrate-binding protein